MLASARPRSAESKFRLLYLGNDLKFIAALRQVLSESVYRLVACSDRGSAVLFLESDIPYDLLLLDFDWREKEGLELARLAQSLGHRKKMPIMMVAATRLSSDRKASARKSGVKECLTKTGDMGAVSDAILRLIGIPGAGGTPAVPAIT